MTSLLVRYVFGFVYKWLCQVAVRRALRVGAVLLAGAAVAARKGAIKLAISAVRKLS